MTGQALDPRVVAAIEARNEHAVAMLAAPDAWASLDLPGWVRERWPGIDLRDPTTLPEPDRCAEGRPWGADPYGSVWGDLDARWRAYADGRRARPCRNRWRDRATLLCGTHLATWQRARDDAAKRMRREQRWHEATELARRLGDLGVPAEAGAGGVLLRPDDARSLIALLVELAGDRARLIDTGVAQAAADRDALLDLVSAVETVMRHRPRVEVANSTIPAAAQRARRHLDRTTRTTPTATPTE